MSTINKATETKIRSLIEGSKVVLFMKGEPDFPQCGFSSQVSQILRHLGVGFSGVNVLEDEEIRQNIKLYSDWPTIPQLYVEGEFIGGCDIISEMFQSGELEELLQEKNLLPAG